MFQCPAYNNKLLAHDQGVYVHCRRTGFLCLLLYLHTVCCIRHAAHKTMLIIGTLQHIA